MRQKFILSIFSSLYLSLSFLSAQTPFWNVFDNQNSDLPSNQINSLHFDQNGNLWVATAQGIAKRSDGLWTLFPLFSGIGVTSDFTNTVAFLEADNSVWAGSHIYGLYRLDSGNWVGQGPFDVGINDLYIGGDQTEIWVASENGLGHFDGTNWEVFNDSTPRFPSIKVKKVKREVSGDIWIGTHPFANYPGGMARYDGTNWFTLNSSDGLPNPFVNDFVIEENGTLWIATDGGIHKRSGANWQTFTPNNSAVPGSQANALAIDTVGNIWAGTDGGIGVFTPRGWTNFTTQNSGLPDNSINDIAFAPDGTAWIGTDNGVAQFDKVLSSSTSSTPNLEQAGHKLRGPFPNPIESHSMKIELELVKSASVSIEIRDRLGRSINHLEEKALQAGFHQFTFDLDQQLTGGIYVLRVMADGLSSSRRFLIK